MHHEDEDLLEKLRKLYPPDTIIKVIDATNLKPNITVNEAIEVIKDTQKVGFRCALLSPSIISYIRKEAKEYGVSLCSVAGFPYGFSQAEAKAKEIALLAEKDVEEVDVVMNLVNVANHAWDLVLNELNLLRDLEKEFGILIKIIIEAPLFTDFVIDKLIHMIFQSGLSFVKTSTGVISKGGDYATVLRVSKVSKKLGIKVKAAGGIKTWLQAALALHAGATRIGSSNYMNLIEHE